MLLVIEEIISGSSCSSFENIAHLWSEGGKVSTKVTLISCNYARFVQVTTPRTTLAQADCEEKY